MSVLLRFLGSLFFLATAGCVAYALYSAEVYETNTGTDDTTKVTYGLFRECIGSADGTECKSVEYVDDKWGTSEECKLSKSDQQPRFMAVVGVAILGGLLALAGAVVVCLKKKSMRTIAAVLALFATLSCAAAVGLQIFNMQKFFFCGKKFCEIEVNKDNKNCTEKFSLGAYVAAGALAAALIAYIFATLLCCCCAPVDEDMHDQDREMDHHDDSAAHHQPRDSPGAKQHPAGGRAPPAGAPGDGDEVDDWVLDEASGMWWSEMAGYYLHHESGHFYDPNTGWWCDPEGNWYEAEE